MRAMGKGSWKVAVLSIVCGMLYWGLPMTLFIEVDKILGLKFRETGAVAP